MVRGGREQGWLRCGLTGLLQRESARCDTGSVPGGGGGGRGEPRWHQAPESRHEPEVWAQREGVQAMLGQKGMSLPDMVLQHCWRLPAWRSMS